MLGKSVCRKPRTQTETGGSAGNFVQHGRPDNCAENLRHDVGEHEIEGKPTTACQAHGDSWIEMTAGNMADRVGHGQNGQAKRKGHAEQPDPHLGKGGRDDRAATATEGQPERAYRLGRKTLSVHGNPPLRAPPRRYIERQYYYKVSTGLSPRC